MEIKPKFKTGEYVYVGNIEDKIKCIYLCTFLEKFYICVSEGFGEDYLNDTGCPVPTSTWTKIYPIEPEFKYPMWFKTIDSKKVVKFSNLCFGQEIIDFNGKYIGDETILHNDWLPHTDIDNWVQVPDPELEFKYPRWFKMNGYDLIVRFDSNKSGEVIDGIIFSIGHYSDNWVPHTDTETWTQIPEPKPTRMVYEYIHQVGDDLFETICIPEDGLTTYMDTYCKPTGRKFEVEL